MIIVEGTATALIVATFAPKNAIVACVLTPNRLTAKTLAKPGMSALSAGRTVILYFEDEPDRSKVAHSNAQAIIKMLEAGTSKAASVTIITTPTDDLRGWLTTTDDAAGVLADLISSAEPITAIKTPTKQVVATTVQTRLGSYVSTSAYPSYDDSDPQVS